MKKKKHVLRFPREKRYNGIFDPDSDEVTLDHEIVSSTEMTGAVPAARRDPYEDDAFENYIFD